MVETDYQIDADDLLHCAAGLVGSKLAYEILDGYTAAYQGSQLRNRPYSKEYRQGYYLCNQSPITLSERQVEILSVISAISALGRE